MQRVAKIAAAAVLTLIALIAVGVIVLVMALRDPSHYQAVERYAFQLSGGSVAVTGLSGTFPENLQIQHLEFHDGTDAWLTADGVAVQWSPLQMLWGRVHIARLSAAALTWKRSPQNKAVSNHQPPGFKLPFRIRVDDLTLARVQLDAISTDRPPVLRVSGTIDVSSGPRGRVALTASASDGGQYTVQGDAISDHLDIHIKASEPAEGLIARLVDLHQAAPLTFAVDMAGTRRAGDIQIVASDGALAVNGKGRIDIESWRVDGNLDVTAPEMSPVKDVSWKTAQIAVQVHGALASPDADSQMSFNKLLINGVSVASAQATLSAREGKLALQASLTVPRIPGVDEQMLARAPIDVRAGMDMRDKIRPMNFSISHPAATLSGVIQTASPHTGTATLSVPSLRSFKDLIGTDIAGHAQAQVKAVDRAGMMELNLEGNVAVTDGPGLPARLLQGDNHIKIAAAASSGNIIVEDVSITGTKMHVNAKGTHKGGVLDIGWDAVLTDLRWISPDLQGEMSARGRLAGPSENFTITGRSILNANYRDDPATHLQTTFQFGGLPRQRGGSLDINGDLLGSALTATARLDSNGGRTHLVLPQIRWRSLQGIADLAFDPSGIPNGKGEVHVGDLADLNHVLGQDMSGSANLILNNAGGDGRPVITHVQGDVARLRLGALGISHATVNGDFTATEIQALQIGIDEFHTDGLSGKASLTASGPFAAAAVKINSTFAAGWGPSDLTLGATIAYPARRVRLNTLTLSYAGETARLQAPAQFDLASGVAVDSLRLASDTTSFTAKGRITPTLDLTLALRTAQAKDGPAKGIVAGDLTGDAALHGTLAAPTGSFRLVGHRFQVRTGMARMVPPGDINLTVTANGDQAQIEGRLASGSENNFHIAGTASFRASRAIALYTDGALDLALFNPLLTPRGITVAGQIDLHTRVTGTADAPLISGPLRLSHASYQDFVQGIHIADLNGVLTGQGDSFAIQHLSGRAGDGAVTLNGSVGIFARGAPVHLHITASNAKLLASDLLTASADADVAMDGNMREEIGLRGKLTVSRADINIPENLPRTVAILNVRRPHQENDLPPPPGLGLKLDLIVEAPQRVFVHGHGLSAEMGGQIHVLGTDTLPEISGGFELRYGQYSLAGQTLDLTAGKVTFDGSSPVNRLDPVLDFTGQKTAYDVTAYLHVTGYADAPKIKISSTPDLPQDEILAHLLFGQSVKQLSPFQIATTAQAVASISGTGSGGDPLSAVRNGLGLDRLTATSISDTTTDSTTIEAGKYVANGIYIGTKQGTQGGTQAHVQIDLTRHLKLDTTVGTSTGTPTKNTLLENDPGNNIGLTYQFEY